MRRPTASAPTTSASRSTDGSPAHALTLAVARALGPAPGPVERSYVALLDRRLSALASVAGARPITAEELGLVAGDVALARTFLRPREASWHDGDENLVRGHVEARAGDSAVQARRLLDTADLLGRIAPRMETVWCFLWLMEAALPSLIEPPQGAC
jgi:hypothetical protein